MYYINNSILKKIEKTIGNSPIESGGIIGIKKNIICAFYFDKKNYNHLSEYYPNYKTLNKVIKRWGKHGIMFAGIIHSHPNLYNKPSIIDYNYAKKILDSNYLLEKLIFPIVTFKEKVMEISFYELQDYFIEIEVKVLKDEKNIFNIFNRC